MNGQESRDVFGLWDNPFSDPVQIASTNPTFTAPSENVGPVRRGWKVNHLGHTWRVSDPPEPDGTGMTRLLLERVT